MSDGVSDGVSDLPTRAQVVVVGGGVVGASVAYHLTKLGVTDVLLLEQGHLSGGTTWHAAGLVGPLRASESGTRLVQYSAELYASLEAETGLSTGYRGVGGVIVARTPERMVQLRRTAANAAAYDMECELVSPERAQELWPPMQVEDLLGALWLPGDGKVNPTDLTQSLAKGARTGGATVRERTRVTGFGLAGRRVTTVHTDAAGERQSVECETVVNCAGQWAAAVGALVGETVPLHSCEHFYVVTEAVEGTHPDLPIMRDPDGWTYFKEEVGGLVVGGFEPEAKAWVAPDQLPHPFEFQLLEEDWEHFSVLMDEAVRRIPALAETGVRKFYNGPESFTPDNQFVLGTTPSLDNYYVAAGFNSVGIASAGGAGRALAEWIVAGEPTSDLVGVDPRRFGSWAADPAYLRARVVETLGLHYALPWPNREPETARDVRRSPLHDRLAARGAVFGTRNGWERPLYFGPPLSYAWGKPAWLESSAAEQRATRTGVAVFDQTSFSKYVVAGPGALEALQWVCAADVDVPVGRVVYTPWLNERGTYEADVTVTRDAVDSFWVVSSAATTVRDLDWLRRHGGIEGEDITDEYAVLGVMGPGAPALLGWADEPLGTASTRAVAGVEVRATRMTYVGEPGWELTVPVASAEAVFDTVSAGGAVDAGYYAIDSLRLEKGYRAFPRELSPDHSPVEAGLVFATALSGAKEFLGRAALVEAKARGPERRLVSLVVESPEPMLWGGELLLADGAPAGQVTSAAWGATVGSCVGLGYLRGGVRPDAAYQVDVAGERHAVRVSLRAPS